MKTELSVQFAPVVEVEHTLECTGARCIVYTVFFCFRRAHGLSKMYQANVFSVNFFKCVKTDLKITRLS